ncbi:MAG: hypothetical protein ACTSVI_01080 [Promethearchaeota archaeon]
MKIRREFCMRLLLLLVVIFDFFSMPIVVIGSSTMSHVGIRDFITFSSDNSSYSSSLSARAGVSIVTKVEGLFIKEVQVSEGFCLTFSLTSLPPDLGKILVMRPWSVINNPRISISRVKTSVNLSSVDWSSDNLTNSIAERVINYEIRADSGLLIYPINASTSEVTFLIYPSENCSINSSASFSLPDGELLHGQSPMIVCERDDFESDGRFDYLNDLDDLRWSALIDLLHQGNLSEYINFGSAFLTRDYIQGCLSGGIFDLFNASVSLDELDFSLGAFLNSTMKDVDGSSHGIDDLDDGDLFGGILDGFDGQSMPIILTAFIGIIFYFLLASSRQDKKARGEKKK